MTRIEFDARKDSGNQLKHGLPLALALEFEWDSASVEPDMRRDYGEERYRAIGFISERLHVVVFTRRVGVIRVIGLRKANRRERRKYGKAQETPPH